MQEHKQRTAEKTRRQSASPATAQQTSGIPNSAISEVLAGKAKPTSEMMGQRQELAPSIADKMSRSFGMDLSGMQVYRSTAMAGSDMEGIASGNKVVLSSDVDLNTTKGQAVLGHEISHIRAQSMGVGTGGRGLYDNAALEHQADTEGLMAAQGKSIYEGGATEAPGTAYGLGAEGTAGMATLDGGLSASAGAPMQAKKMNKKQKARRQKSQQSVAPTLDLTTLPQGGGNESDSDDDSQIPDPWRNDDLNIDKMLDRHQASYEDDSSYRKQIKAEEKKRKAAVKAIMKETGMSEEDALHEYATRGML